MAFKFYNIAKANAEIQSAEETLAPALEKSGVKTISIEGKTVALSDAPLAAKISTLLSAQPVVSGAQTAAEAIQSNDLIATELEKTNTRLALQDTAVESLSREKSDLSGKLAVADSALQDLTVKNGVLISERDAAVRQFNANAQTISSFNTELSQMCLAVGCVELKDEKGLLLAADSDAASRLAAADRIPVADKLKSYQGAVNSALTRVGVSVERLPSGNGNTRSVSTVAALQKYESITDPTERVNFYRANKAAIDASFKQ